MASALRTRLQDALNRARKDRDRLRTAVLSTTLSELRNREIELGREASEEEALAVVARARKQRLEASEQMNAGGRTDLAEKEAREAEILTEFLPEPLDEEAVRGRIRELIQDGFDQAGPLMGRLMPEIRGRFDGRDANRIVQEELGRGP